jgi:hypothetical protein
VTIAELGALGEFLASIGMLVTLIVLAFELRQNTKSMRRANVRQATDSNSRALNALLDEGVAEIFIRGLKSLDSLSDVERYRFDNSFHQWLTSCEQVFIDHRAGMFEDDDFVGYENAIPAYLTTPGGQVWWGERQAWYSRRFRADVARLCAQAPTEAATAGPKLDGA